MCLSLCACGDGGNGSETQGSTAGEVADPIVYDSTSFHPMLSMLYGKWTLDNGLSWIVMPLKILFREDGTCFVEFPDYAIEQTKEMLWGIVPECLDNSEKLFVRIGVEDDIWYICSVSSDELWIAAHATPEEDGIPFQGLSGDCYEGMMFDMHKADVNTDNAEG